MGYTTYDGTLIDADADAPTLILDCPACHAHIPFLGDGDEQVIDDTLTLPEFYIVTCPRCDAVFGEGDALELVQDADDEQSEVTRKIARAYGEASAEHDPNWKADNDLPF